MYFILLKSFPAFIIIKSNVSSYYKKLSEFCISLYMTLIKKESPLISSQCNKNSLACNCKRCKIVKLRFKKKYHFVTNKPID